MVIGYTTGVFDLFHIGHLNILRSANALCDRLIVGVSTDKLVKEKGKKALVPFKKRIEIVRAIKYVDVAVPQTTINKIDEWDKLGFDKVFVGDDWYDDENWIDYERGLESDGVKFIYFPHTDEISSTLRRARLK